ncbi:MAG TPA: hypothetical protein VGO93_24530 [Candidatus Xenobia bacterium]|jgi:hypothetical protein
MRWMTVVWLAWLGAAWGQGRLDVEPSLPPNPTPYGHATVGNWLVSVGAMAVLLGALVWAARRGRKN